MLAAILKAGLFHKVIRFQTIISVFQIYRLVENVLELENFQGARLFTFTCIFSFIRHNITIRLIKLILKASFVYRKSGHL